MLEGLAAWILNTYVGEYFENLNTDQLSIGLLQGEVELENLPLRKDALKALGLPVEVYTGFVGKIKLQIPVSRLRSEPWVIIMEKLFLIAGPISSFEYDEKAEEDAALSRKLSLLESLDAKSKGNQGTKPSESYYTNWMSYGTSLMANVIENVQLKIKDVHIRYEDEESCLNQTFACGILIHSLSAQSTDQTWAPKFVRRDDSDFMWKLLELQGLSLYWDSTADILSGLDQKNLMAAMAMYFEPSSENIHEYILAPVNAEAHLTRNCSLKPLRSRFTPRIVCDIHLQKIPLSLSEAQYRQMMECLKAFEVLDVRWKHRKWRPLVPVKDNAKKWWMYAVDVNLLTFKENNKACKWDFAFKRAQDIVKYSKVYQDYLNKSEITEESKILKEELEKKLSYDLLVVLRELVANKIKRTNNAELESEESKGKGFLQWMFPSWGGWYSDTSNEVSTVESNGPLIDVDHLDSIESNRSEVDDWKTHLEEEILDVLDSADDDSLLKRDTVFAQLNFSLSQGTFSLLQSESQVTSPGGRQSLRPGKPIIDLEFSDMSTKLETRPRNGSFLFEIKLGALYLHDRIFDDTHFPHIIAPQNRDISFVYKRSSSITVFPLPPFLNQKPEELDAGSYLFELSYEKKPFTVHADHRLNITTRALDVVYNPQVLQCITDFFCLHHGKSSDFSVGELKLTAAARARYETLKQQTKAELQHKWDQILDGEDKTVYSRGWNLELAISAPQIIIPENINDKDSSVVVLDLGKLHLFNARKEVDRVTPSSDDMDDDEDFITPCSTPQELLALAEKANKLREMMSKENDSHLLKEHIYEKYTLELSNIQILVSRLKDNWKFAQLRGTSTMHIVDRFSITVQTERRMVYTQDPEWPSVAITGNLPKLIVHVSEQKVNALQTCFDVLNSPISNKPIRQPSQFSSPESPLELENINERSFKEKKHTMTKELLSEGQADGSENFMLLMEFCVDQMSFDVQSRGHSVAELQVTGVKTTLSKRPSDLSVSLCVHSLLLVDALQTYGPDFELLLASHKHLSMDSMSGSLMDSEPNSPTSPGSPDAISSPLLGKSIPTPPAALSAALSSLKTDSTRKWSSSLTVPKTEQYASDALITMEFSRIESPSSESCPEVLQIASLQFNNLDVIANQETIVELVDFIKRIALERNRKVTNGKLSPSQECNKSSSDKEGSLSQYISRTEITFDFHRLNILLLRAVSHKHSTLGQKVATATISGARIQATIGTIIEIQGSLGGLQVQDLITENTKHQKIVSIGYDPLTVQPVDLLNQLEQEMYKSIKHFTPLEPENALTFTITRGDKAASLDGFSFSQEGRQKGYLDITLRMASLCYTHSPRLLHELSSCATEFKAYMKSLASSIKTAATEVAFGIVTKRTGSISASLHGNNPDGLSLRSRYESTDDIADDNVFMSLEDEDVTVDMKLDVLLETPVVAFPTAPQSSDVLVAHLGRIAIQKGATGILNSDHFSIDLSDLNEEGNILVEFRDMNMHFVNTKEKARVSTSKEGSESVVVPNLSIKDLYACEDKRRLIIHDTVLEIVINSHSIDVASAVNCFMTEESSGVHYEKSTGMQLVEVRGMVVNPLRVVLSKHQFQQMTKVIDNLTYSGEAAPAFEFRSPGPVGTSESSDELSALKTIGHSVRSEAKLHNPVQVLFKLPDLITELRDDLTDRDESSIVSITFQEFLLEYRMEKTHESTLQVTLQTLLMEDLRNLDDTQHCYLMSSVNQIKIKPLIYPELPKSTFISTSCPSLSDASPYFPNISSHSLPDRLCTQNMFSLSSGRKLSSSSSHSRSRIKTECYYPSTPPPSPTLSRDLKSQTSCDALVSINVTFIDKKSPYFTKKYNKTGCFIDIDFNCLDIILNLQTWVMVIDFFSSAGDAVEKPLDKSTVNMKSSSYPDKKMEVESKEVPSNSEIMLKVKSLTVVLNKPEYKLASANISNFSSNMSFREVAYTIKGTLGSISVSDLSPHGSLYPEKFITTGNEALLFDIFKFNNDGGKIETDYDMSVKCQMSSVQYVHTQRFLTEVTTFFRHFNEMQELIRRIRLASSGADVNPENTRGSRIKLNISAGSPVIAIPQSATLANVLVANLGRITVSNTFLHFGSEGTIYFSKQASDTEDQRLKRTKSAELMFLEQGKCLLDVINVELADMDWYSAVHIPCRKSKKEKSSKPDPKDLVFPSFWIRKQGNDLLQQKFMLRVQVERNLDSTTNHLAPDWAVDGVVSSVYVTLDNKQYTLIYGILNQNLGEPLEEFTFEPGAEAEQFVIIESGEKAWTTMAIHMDLVNVSLELIRNEGVVNKPGENSLAKFDFIKSRLSFEAYSDNSRDIDLVSNMIQVSDIRYKDAPFNNRPNVFTQVLKPTTNKDNNGSTLQAEVHYRITHDSTRFTVLLNNMRIMGVFEFLESVLNFLTLSSSAPSTPQSEASPSSNKVVAKAQSQSKFEMKINVTDTEFVVLEDTSVWDSNAVICKTTAVITWKPNFYEKPLSCSLQSLEVFSCILGVEEDTALSIIDPLTVSIEVVNKPNSPLFRLESAEVQHVLEMSAINLNLRLSYYDITMFSKILESIKRQTAFYTKPSTSPSPVGAENETASSSIDCLTALGFSSEDCKTALSACKGNLNDAALWLTQHSVPAEVTALQVVEKQEVPTEKKKVINLCSAEIRLSSFSLCVIDDCRDADVPVIELTLTEVQFVQKFLTCPEGYGNFGFAADYYNRALSGWEPVMEPWNCSVKWKVQPVHSRLSKKVSVGISSNDAINLNVTSALIELFKTVKKNWTEEYRNINNRVSNEINSPGCYRRRLPFVPFALKNDTGGKLWFATQITSAMQQSVDLEADSTPTQNSKFSMSWTEVPSGNLVPVPFESRSKIRHKDSHSMKLHQIIVRAEGWMPSAPVSVDRVGTYFRHAAAQKSHSASSYSERPSARIVFDVALEGSARKLITVQSSLLVANKLQDPIELKLENSGVQYGGAQSLTFFLVPGQTLPIPLCFVHAQMWARPADKHVAFCNHSISWHDVSKRGEIRGSVKQCSSVKKTSDFYRFLVLSKRRKFPSDRETSSPPSIHMSVQPAHKIYFMPYLEMINLLPYDLHYFLKDSNTSGYIKPGKGSALHNIDIADQFYIKFFLDSFKKCKDVALSSTSRHFPSRIELRDNLDRLLVLNLKVLNLPGGGLKLFLSAPYWLVNKTGLPLLFRQEGTNSEAAGQFEEHELARCLAPLLFSCSDQEASTMCNMRVGRSLHSDGVPQWCMRFTLEEEGINVRQLHIIRKDSRPDWVYNIGIEVRVGKGRYGNTRIVTLSPRYQLVNQTSHKLEFCQLFFANKDNRQYVLSAMPKSSLAFHWPRIDLDNLLCVSQPDISDCNWSGGFPIDNIQSFHINMRDGQGKSNFLRVEIILQGATFFIIFTDADKLPPPFRIDNHSEVTVTYYQTNVEHERLKTSIRPHCSVPYAFDSPILPPYITLCAPGGSAATYDMNIFREGSQLFYENFIYIVFTGTFPADDLVPTPHSLSSKEYVLDVLFGNKVVINRREVGKRSQLWRMTSTGMLQHEGSSPPRDPHKPNSANLSKILVLDIADLGPQPGEYTPLVLRKPDARRKHTQTWKFTSEGRLCCAYPNVYVQSKDGFKGLRRGNEVVLGPSLPVSFVSMENGIPIEQAISRKKLRGGSGMLSVKVVPDGPTRVLKISDIQGQKMVARSSPKSSWVVVENQVDESELESPDSESSQSSSNKDDIELQIGLQFTKGLGVSIINHLSEELVYVWLHNIVVEYNKAATYHSLGGSIKNIQVDNQLRDAEKPVMIFVTQQSATDEQRHLPAFHFTIQRISTQVLNADIFKHLIVTIKNLTVHLEEVLLLKLIQFAGFHQKEIEGERTGEKENQNQKMITESMAYEKRYYFSTLKLSLQQIKLSVLTSSNLQTDLVHVKKKMRLTLIRFEDANIECSSFLRVHPFETAEFLIESIVEHYKEELKSEAIKILGAVDFLGNPIGFVNDVSDGISKLIKERSVTGLVKNITHGTSDSAAKLLGSLSDGLGIVAMDDKHQQMRKQIKQNAVVGNRPFVAGLKGLGFGLYGGFTSVFQQTYEGVTQEGFQGLLSGFGKGLIGTVTKPTAGFLDLASGAATAIKDKSKESSHAVLTRSRPPRTCVGSSGLLPRYSFQQALGQDFLYNLNNRDYSELFIAKEQIRSGSEDLHALISSEQVYFLSSGSPSTSNVVLTVPFTDLYKCSYVFSDAGVIGEVRHYLQLIMKAENAAGSITVPNDSSVRRHSRSGSVEPLYKKPQVRCDSEEVAQKVAMQINYAKSLHEERIYMVLNDDDSDED